MNFIIFICCSLSLSWRKPVMFGFPQDTQFPPNTSIPPASNLRSVKSTAHPVYLNHHPLSSPEGFCCFEALIHHRIICLVALAIAQSLAHLNSPRRRRWSICVRQRIRSQQTPDQAFARSRAQSHWWRTQNSLVVAQSGSH